MQRGYIEAKQATLRRLVRMETGYIEIQLHYFPYRLVIDVTGLGLNNDLISGVIYHSQLR